MKKEEKRRMKEEFLNLKTLTRKKEKKQKIKVDKPWVIKITLLTFCLAFCFSVISDYAIANVTLIPGIVILFFFIFLGVLFDMIGVAVTSADSEPFHSMSSRKVKGAKTAVKLLKNADKVSSFCNDVVGDICGIISGSAAVIISVIVVETFQVPTALTALLVTALIASFTIGFKAIGKSYAMNKNNLILFRFAKFLSRFKEE